MKQSLLFALVYLLVGCMQSDTPASLLSAVNVTDGVTRSEARRIAEAYFSKHVGCGTYSGVSETDGAWVVEGKHGFAGNPIQGFLITKQFGAVTSPVRPSYASPEDMLRQAQRGATADASQSPSRFAAVG